MVKVNLIVVGNLKEAYLRDAQNEYLKRLSRYVKIEIIEVNEAKIVSFDNLQLMNKTLDEEGDNVLKHIKNNDYLYLVDLHGKEIDSEAFADSMQKNIDNGASTIDFVIGGTLGLSDKLRERANYKISLSKLTFPHQLTRIVVLEQIYRACKINNNESYHH